MSTTFRSLPLALLAAGLISLGAPALADTSDAALNGFSGFGATGAAWAQPGDPAAARSALEQRNRAVIQAFYAQVLGQGRVDRIEAFVAPNLIQHDPAIAAGRPGLAEAVRAQLAASPPLRLAIKRTIADGDFVLVHSQLTATPGNEFSGTAQVDLYRLADGRIVEHWAVRQPVPASAASGRSMFSDDYRYTGQPAAPTQAREEANKALALKLLPTLFAGQDVSVVDRYWAANFIQHNPQAPDGRGPLQGIAFVPKPTPFGAWNTRIAVAEGDLVFVLSQSVATAADLTTDFNGTAAGDLFRIVGGIIVEHWDVLAAVPASSRNGNSPFSQLYVAPR